MTIDLDTLERRAKAATPGPWEDLSEHPDHLRGTINKGAKHIAGCSWFETPREEQCVTVKEALANAAFIAAANPTVVLELIAEIRHLRGERDCLAKVLSSVSVRGILHPSGGFAPACDYDAPQHRCFQCWLKAAQETTEEYYNDNRP